VKGRLHTKEEFKCVIKVLQLRRVWLGLIRLMTNTSFECSVLECYIV
jgi:hypothetical protein